jgi:hypothetical protein
MAIFPCDWTGHRYGEAQRTIYVITAFGDDVNTTKLRLCPQHFRDGMALTRDYFSLVGEDSRISDHCELCEKDKIYACYVKCFDLKQEPEYWAVDLCASCWERVRGEMHVQHGHPMGSATPA